MREKNEKVIILGCPGSGKSRFARILREKTGFPLYHLDNIWWKKDRTTVSREEFDKKLDIILKKPEWIIDGDYSRTYEMRIKACDTVFFFDFDKEECLAGINERLCKPRSDLPFEENAPDPELIDRINNYKTQKRPAVLELLKKYGDKTVHVFRSRADCDRWLETTPF